MQIEPQMVTLHFTVSCYEKKYLKPELQKKNTCLHTLQSLKLADIKDI